MAAAELIRTALAGAALAGVALAGAALTGAALPATATAVLLALARSLLLEVLDQSCDRALVEDAAGQRLAALVIACGRAARV